MMLNLLIFKTVACTSKHVSRALPLDPYISQGKNSIYSTHVICLSIDISLVFPAGVLLMLIRDQKYLLFEIICSINIYYVNFMSYIIL